MLTVDRRAFLRLMSSAAVTSTLIKSIDKALAVPAQTRTGTIDDVQHIVFLMQENRSFDHYFGTLRGVRGYGDTRPVTLPSGKPVWYQPDGSGYLLPFHPAVENLGLQFIQDLPHNWQDTHAAWNGGQYDQWIANKGRTSMAYLTRQDIPFHYALADAFTICDGYHCSLLGSTDPNRYHMWTGWVGNNGAGGGPVINNAEAGYDWSTYPERLERAGVSWKIYQDVGIGLDAAGVWGWTTDPYIGNFGDNSLLYFHQYQNAQPGSPLYEKARTGTQINTPGTPFDALFSILRADVRNAQLPQVSWIVAPEAFSEHGNWPANYGAWYVSQVLDALTSNPDVWAKTALFVCYDENDGFFDHIVPPTPPRSAAEGASTVDASDEIFAGNSGNARGPYGLGVRVPLLVISPWSKGGWVCSEVFDHTSLIRFVEARFARQHPEVVETNITAWRRAVTGDLTSAFNFATPNATPVTLPQTAPYVPPDRNRHSDYIPVPPQEQSLPSQEPGLRRARALPYELHVAGTANGAASSFRIDFHNTGTAGAHFHVRAGSPADGPWTYTVEAGKSLANSWNVHASQGRYDLSVFGPNGFLRQFRGTAAPNALADLEIRVEYAAQDDAIVLRITNYGHAAIRVRVENSYSDDSVVEVLNRGKAVERSWSVKPTFGWYDLSVTTDSDSSFLRRAAGHLEHGRHSFSDPALGGVVVEMDVDSEMETAT
jgi:phospholipase C